MKWCKYKILDVAKIERYRMFRNLFLRIVDAIEGHDMYFDQHIDAVGSFGLYTLQKITFVFKMLACDAPVNTTDEYVKIGASTAIESMKRFCRAIAEVFGEKYLRSPTSNDVARLCTSSSHLFFDFAAGIAPPIHYIIQEKEYDMSYYLADNIYLKWSTLVQTIRDPCSPQKKYFVMKQESCRKDVEHAFRVLLARFAIVVGPSRIWRKKVLHDIITTCIILHNMIIEDECDFNAPIQDDWACPPPTVEMIVDANHRFE
ncbi:uncharacterized protein [Nicotiana tomentosiformis]|uniref:uncharacterized protein n=1 Tax=Nicotiana tomentosiformis TaxID=4098 RepID=UPI00388CD6B7